MHFSILKSPELSILVCWGGYTNWVHILRLFNILIPWNQYSDYKLLVRDLISPLFEIQIVHVNQAHMYAIVILQIMIHKNEYFIFPN